jgi:polar amino acid transport system permease protein
VSDQLLNFLRVEDIFRASPDRMQDFLSLILSEPGLITPFLSGVLTLALFQGAYIAEIVRAGIQAIDTGQWEAGQALGLTRWKMMRLIILPQAARIMLPPLANEFINTIKWSSIVSIISIQELTFQGLQVMASTQATIEVWLTISFMYLILCLLLSLIVRRIEIYLGRSDRVVLPGRQYAP